jgi:CHAT domain-containing protein/tetratricopeptide (TPR) repeat protein
MHRTEKAINLCKITFLTIFVFLTSCSLSKKWKKIEAHRVTANEHLENERYEEAINSFENILLQLANSSSTQKFDQLYRASILISLSDIYLQEHSKSNTVKAIKLLKEAEVVYNLHKKNEYLARVYLGLGLAYQLESNSTNYSSSLVHYKKALSIYENLNDLENVSICQKHMGSVHYRMGRFKECVDAYRNSLNHFAPPTTLQSFKSEDLEYFSGAYLELGHSHLARKILSSVVSSGGSRSEKIKNFRIFNSLGLTFSDANKDHEAKLNFMKSLKLGEEVWGKDHPELAPIYHNLGSVAQDTEQSINYFEKALELCGLELSEHHTRLVPTYSALMSAYHQLEDINKTIFFAEKIISIESNNTVNPTSLANAYKFLGLVHAEQNNEVEEIFNFKKALNVTRRFFGDTHPETFARQSDLIESYWYWGKNAEQHDLTETLLEGQSQFVNKVFSYLPLDERLDFLGNKGPFSCVSNSNKPNLILKSLLHRKGLVLDSFLEDKAEGKNIIMNDEAITSLILDINKTNLRRAFSLQVSELKKAIPDDFALIDYIIYSNWDQNDSEWIGAIVIDGKTKTVSWHSLCDAETVFSEVELLKKSFGGDLGSSKPTLEKLYQKVLEPLETNFSAGISNIIVCPDSELSFIPFHALLQEDNSFLCEKFNVLNISSSRDLILKKHSPSNSKLISIFANPQFNDEISESKEELALRAVDKIAMRNLEFSPLLGSQEEANILRGLASKHDFLVDFRTGKDASEKNLRKIASPMVLHLATHGFYISAENNSQRNRFSFLGKRSSTGPISNPMHRSGLALSGAKDTISFWEYGKHVDPENDGILTAEEASKLDLSNTWLTVLSACDTGSGVARAGEGVLGLRRAFAMAGTQNLLLTLWPVSDSFTKDFMVSFYKEALESGNAPKAMAKVQREWLVKLREERSISQAVKLAGPFVLTFRGNPELN